MEGVLKKHQRIVTLKGYKVYIATRNNTAVIHWTEYYESEKLSRVYKHLLHKFHPWWMYDIKGYTKLCELLENIDLMTDSKVEKLFLDIHNEAEKVAGDDSCSIYYITVEEYCVPHFETV